MAIEFPIPIAIEQVMFGSALAGLPHRGAFTEAAVKALSVVGHNLSPDDLQQRLYVITLQQFREQRTKLGGQLHELPWFIIGCIGWFALSKRFGIKLPVWYPDEFTIQFLTDAASELGIESTPAEMEDCVHQIATRCKTEPALKAIDLATAYFAEMISYLSSAAIRSGHRTKLHTPAMSSFISYSHTNEGWVDSLAIFLQAHAVRVWLAPLDLRSGAALDSGLKRAIQMHECLIVILTADSLTSHWVGLEIATAVNERKEVIPVSLVPMTDVKCSKLWSDLSRFLILDCSALSPIDAYREVLRNLQKKSLDLTRWRADEGSSLAGLLGLFTGRPNPSA